MPGVLRAIGGRSGRPILSRATVAAVAGTVSLMGGHGSLVPPPAWALTVRAPHPSGCHAAWPVVTHHPGGGPARRTGRAVACAAVTRYATSETTLAISPDGTMFFSPANTENSLASSVGGSFWILDAPRQEQYTSLWNTVDPFVTVDRRTGRVFWIRATGELRTAPGVVDESPLGWNAATAVAYAHGFQVYSSSDDGLNWTTADLKNEATGDWEKVFVGPPRPAGPRPSGYPDVVYACANAPFEVSGPGRDCYRSLDGGRSFSLAGFVTGTAASPHDVCPPLAGGANGGVARDGTFFQPQSCSGGSYVAVSKDEAINWTWYPIPGAPGTSGLTSNLQLALDAADNLYAMWSDGKKIDLAISRTGGRSWSRPLSIGLPGQGLYALPALAAGPAGHVGVAYYAAATAAQKKLTGYITQTSDALAARPLLVSGALNDPAQPIFQDYGLTGGATPRADYVGAAYDATGHLWAGLVKQLGAPDSSGTVPTTGYVGTLAPRPAKPSTKRCPSGRVVKASARCPARRVATQKAKPKPKRAKPKATNGDPDHDGDIDRPGGN